MMVNSTSECQSSRAINVTKGFLLSIGFYIVLSVMVTVTQHKFVNLKKQMELYGNVESSVADKTRQLDCLTRNIYWEAATEPFEGKVAVAQVTINRVDSGQFGKDICGVVFQKNIIYEKVLCQFSWVCEGNWKTKPVAPKLYSESEEVAKKVLFENFRLPGLTEAIYYHADYVKPGWNRHKLTKIGQHIFYK